MKRYWLFFLMAFVPCLALGVWASWEFVQREQQDEIALRYSFREVAEDAGRRALTGMVAGIDQALATTTALQALAELPGVYHAFVPTTDGTMPPVVRATPPPRSVSTTTHDARLLEARRLEFVVEDLPAAERAYRELAASKVAPDVIAEANAGLVAVLNRRGDPTQAAGTLLIAVTAREIAPDQAAALALVCAEGGLPEPLAQAILLLVERSGCGNSLHARLLKKLAEQRSELSEKHVVWFERVKSGVEREQQQERFNRSLDQATRHWLIERVRDAAGGWYRTPNGTVLRAGTTRPVVVCQIDANAWWIRCEAELARHAGLAVLARTYQERHRRSIGELIPVVQIDTPWKEPMWLRTPPSEVVPTQWLSTRDVILLMVGIALAMMLAGFLFLYRTARRDLESMRRRSDFVSNVSHELKTPLSLVRMFGEMLSLNYARDDNERRAWYGIIVQESTRLSHLITNVLDFAAMEKGTRRYASEPIDLAALITELIETYRPQLDRDGFAISSELSPALVLGDRGALTQVFINLLTNAMQYSRDQKSIFVSAQRQAGDAVLSITDRGIGIAPEHQQRIFESFFRVESGLTRETRGTGIGLSLVRAIVEAHHGRIEVESALGSGSTFRVRLPAVEPT